MEAESVGTLAANVAQCAQQLRQCSLSVQESAMHALANNISGGLSFVISSLAQSLLNSSCSSSSPDHQTVVHTLGALASALTIYDDSEEAESTSDPPIVIIEQTLAKQLQHHPLFLVQERTIEALASLYGNSFLSAKLTHSEAKRMLVGLITTMATTNKVRDKFVRALVTLCSNNEGKNLWHALQGRKGVQLLISLLRGRQQEYAVGLLCLLSNENDESKPAIIAAGGIPPLVHLLKPIPDCPRAPFLALGLLTQLAKDCPPHNRIVIVDLGALETLTYYYLSFGPQDDDATKEAAIDLIGLLFSTPRIQRHKCGLVALSPLIAVLQKGGRGVRCSAAKALKFLFLECDMTNTETCRQAFPPLAEILNTDSEEEQQHAAIAALVSLLADYSFMAHDAAYAETISVDVLCRILSSNCSMELKRDAAALCSLIFKKATVMSSPATASCVEPLVSLLAAEFKPCHRPVVDALYVLVDDDKLAELVVALGAVVPLVHLLKGSKENNILLVSVCWLLKKLGKQRPACREEMLNAGAIKMIDEVYLEEPRSLLADALSKLLRLLTNNKRGREERELPVVREREYIRREYKGPKLRMIPLQERKMLRKLKKHPIQASGMVLQDFIYSS